MLQLTCPNADRYFAFVFFLYYYEDYNRQLCAESLHIVMTAESPYKLVSEHWHVLPGSLSRKALVAAHGTWGGLNEQCAP